MSETRCVDKSVDDVSFLSYVIRNMQQLLPGVPIKSQVAVSGYSNGGMMIQTLLCKQPDIANHLAGVALIGTMMGSDFASSSCKQNLPRSLPLVWVHGLKDPVLPYSAGSSLGVKALGAGKRLLHVRRCYPVPSVIAKIYVVLMATTVASRACGHSAVDSSAQSSRRH